MGCAAVMRFMSGFLILTLSEVRFSLAEISCKDNNGNIVDWFVVYKLPRDKSEISDVAEGLAVYYMDVNRPKWELNPRNINASGQAVQLTLQQIYDNKNSKDVMFVLYNDETPEKNVSYYNGHTKGDIAFDKQSGFWLVHSIPRFPPYVQKGYSYPYSGLSYGQTMLCMTYKYKQLNVIGDQLKYNFPQVYDYKFPSSFASDNPNIKDVVNNKHTEDKSWNHITQLTSLGGSQMFTTFAKYSRFDADLYADLVSPYYQADLLVESWRNGGTPLPSNCTGSLTVKNICQLKFDAEQFRYTKDHSKWAIAENKYVTCIGDINREKSQEKRAGGTVCFDNPYVWKGFHSLVISTEPCPSKKSMNNINKINTC